MAESGLFRKYLEILASGGGNRRLTENFSSKCDILVARLTYTILYTPKWLCTVTTIKGTYLLCCLDSYLVPITLSSSTTWIDTFVTRVRSCPSVTTASKSYEGCSNLEMLSTTVMVPDRSSTAKGTATYYI